MDLLLDTNAFIWWLDDSPRIGGPARTAISDPLNGVFVSAATFWELAIKLSLKKLNVRSDATSWVPQELARNRFRPLPVQLHHALAVEHLPFHHRDPFDRLLIAQAIEEDLTIITGDSEFEAYAVRVIRA